MADVAKPKTAMTDDERRVRYKKILAAAVEDSSMDAMLWKMKEDPHALRSIFAKMTKRPAKCGCRFQYHSVVLEEHLLAHAPRCVCCGPENHVVLQTVKITYEETEDGDDTTARIASAELVTGELKWRKAEELEWYDEPVELKREPWDIVKVMDTQRGHILHIVHSENVRDFLRIS